MTLVRLMILVVLAATPAGAGVTSHSMTVDSDARSYHLYVPRTLPEHPALVIVLHGGGGKGLQIMRYTRKRFNQLADEHGFVVVYPDALDGLWDFGEGTVSDALPYRRDDMKFLSLMITRLSNELQVDRARIFATGISRGGQASFALACKRPGLIRAIAPVAMPLPDFLADDCAQSMPLPMLMIHGTEDPIVPYHGGPITIGRKDRGSVLSTDQTITRFAARNRCSAVRVSEEAGEVDKIRYTACAAPVWLFRVEGGGHTWPSARRGLPKRIVGETNQDINAADEIWGFFQMFR